MKKGKKKIFPALVLGMMMMLCLTCTVLAAPKNKIVTKNGKQYYYNNSGKLVKGKYGYKIGSKYYSINKKGVLTRVTKAEGLAGIQLNAYYGKSKSAALYKAFQWSASLKYYTNATSGKNAAWFATFGFQQKRGDCNVQAATFYYMAKVLGYKAKFVQGYVPQALDSKGNPSKFGSHAWVTIKMGSKTYVFDPNLYGTIGTRNGVKYGWKHAYGEKGTYRYFSKKKVEIK